MNFTLSEEQEMLKTMGSDFLEDKCPKTLVRELEEDEKGYSPELWKEMVELGWMGLVFPEKYGGSEMTYLDLAVLIEEIGKACLPGPYFSTVVLGGLPILYYGSDAQKEEYLPKIAGGDAIFTMALNEESAGYNAADIGVKAAAEGDGYVISGTKLFVPDAHVADYIITAARTSDTEEGITVFIVDAKAAGVTTTLLKTVAKDRLCEVVFDNVKVTKDAIIGEADKGWEVVKGSLERATVAKCCFAVGTMQQTLDLTVEYAKERKQFGKPIGTFQVVQHYCANMSIDVEGARFATWEAAWRINNGMPCTMEVAIAKSFVNEAFERVSTLAHQIHGAIGCTIDHDLQFYTRYGKAAVLTFGGSDHCREIIAQEMGM